MGESGECMIKTPPNSNEYERNYDKVFRKAGVAQTVERLPCKQDVTGSIPVSGSIIIKCQDEDIILD